MPGSDKRDRSFQLDFYDQVMARSEAGSHFFRPILMQFAAHWIGASYRDFYLDHRVLVEANLACQQEFGLDAVGLISDPMREAEAFGAECEYPEEMVPHCPDPPVQSIADVEALNTPDLYGSPRTRDRIEGARLFRESLEEDFPVIGWVEGPLAEACDLVGVAPMLLKLGVNPAFSRNLLAKMVPTAKAFASAQIEAGCQIIGVGDAICSQISPRMYAEFVKELHREIFTHIQAQGALVKLHICGDITHLLPHLAELKPDIVDLDWIVDLEEAYRVLGPGIIRTGNLDPAAVIESRSVEEVFARTQGMIARERGRPYILAGGCEITPLTPPENLLAMRRAAKRGE